MKSLLTGKIKCLAKSIMQLWKSYKNEDIGEVISAFKL